ncbi:uncharacterized protein [Nicotiana sylvestris]|uniref:uncharacterized protein n=1 Tax=Nicotiana sylvestris TaxID=4096 RepID=UPI00388C6826
MEHLRKVFQVLRENELYIKREKCEFAQSKVHFLGCVISNGELRMDEAKVRAIQEWEAPTKTEHCQKAFKGLKVDVIEELVLALPEFAKTFEDKAEQQQLGGFLEPLPVAERPWESVTMDFITCLANFDDYGTIMRSESTGWTPFELATGQQPQTPHSLPVAFEGKTLGAYHMAKGWEEHLDTTKSYLDKAAKKMKKFVDCKRHPTDYRVGDMVMVKFNLRQFKAL